VALVVSASNIDRYLKRKDLPFEIKLALPTGVLKLQARPIHYTRQSSPSGSVTYFIGSCFTDVSKPQIATLESFLKTLPVTGPAN
jgi:hypothetical protein